MLWIGVGSGMRGHIRPALPCHSTKASLDEQGWDSLAMDWLKGQSWHQWIQLEPQSTCLCSNTRGENSCLLAGGVDWKCCTASEKLACWNGEFLWSYVCYHKWPGDQSSSNKIPIDFRGARSGSWPCDATARQGQSDFGINCKGF